LVRKRADWFQSQRAYPFKQIPAGALQNAMDQRNAMIRKQRAGLSLAAPLITFPGNGLWQLIGPQPSNIASFPGLENFGFPTVSGRVTALAVDTADTTGNTIYLGAAAGGVWKTTNGGANWTPLTDNQPSLAVGSIAVDPNNHNTIYVGTGEENFAIDSFYGAGILKSTDGGATWTQLGASLFAGAQSPIGGAKIGAIAVQPGNPNIVLAAVTYIDGGTKGGIYRSVNAGATWAQVSGANAPIGAAGTEVIFEPTVTAGNAVVYAAMGDPFGGAANGIYKSLDSGVTWTKLSGGLPASNVGRIRLGYAPSTSGAGATLYAAIANSGGSSADLLGFFSTTNGGTSWTQLNATPNFSTWRLPYTPRILNSSLWAGRRSWTTARLFLRPLTVASPGRRTPVHPLPTLRKVPPMFGPMWTPMRWLLPPTEQIRRGSMLATMGALGAQTIPLQAIHSGSI
jgi:hypothetical protein